MRVAESKARPEAYKLRDGPYGSYLFRGLDFRGLAGRAPDALVFAATRLGGPLGISVFSFLRYIFQIIT